jgi:hypothetical protein
MKIKLFDISIDNLFVPFAMSDKSTNSQESLINILFADAKKCKEQRYVGKADEEEIRSIFSMIMQIKNNPSSELPFAFVKISK